MAIIRGTRKLFTIIRSTNRLEKILSDSERVIIAYTFGDSYDCKGLIKALLTEQEEFKEYMTKNNIDPYCINASKIDSPEKIEATQINKTPIIIPTIGIYENSKIIKNVSGLMNWGLLKMHLSKAYQLNQ